MLETWLSCCFTTCTISVTISPWWGSVKGVYCAISQLLSICVCLVHWVEKEHEPKTSGVNFGTYTLYFETRTNTFLLQEHQIFNSVFGIVSQWKQLKHNTFSIGKSCPTRGVFSSELTFNLLFFRKKRYMASRRLWKLPVIISSHKYGS